MKQLPINLIKDLRRYDARVLAYPDIGNTEIDRDEFISDTGLIFYSKERLAFTPVSFSIEFKGSKEKIRENRNKVSKLLDIATITFDNEVFYKGRFLAESVETRYWYQVVTFKGKAIAMLNTERIEIPLLQNVKIENNGNLPTPCRIIFEGNGSNVILKGFEDPISIKSLDNDLIIDAEKGVTKLNDVDFLSLPYIDKTLELYLTGSGNFKCFVEFEGRIIC